MAGSYNHITNDDGKWAGTNLIENLGDAHEALEQCYGMIQVLSWVLEDATLDFGSLHTRADYIKWAEDNWEHGMKIAELT